MNRRNFMIKGGLATAAIGSSTPLMAHMLQKESANDTISIGIIGTGDRGGGLIPHIQKINQLKLAACCDIIPFRLDAALKTTQGNSKGVYRL